MKQARKAKRPQSVIKKMAKELEPVELKRGTEYLLRLFDDLDAERGYDIVPLMTGATFLPRAITSMELEAFCRLRDIQITPWEAQTIAKMDRAFREESAKLRGN